MWLSKKRFREFEKKIADLEKKVESQQNSVSVEEVSLLMAKRLEELREASHLNT